MIARAHCLEHRIAVQAVDPHVPGARFWTDDPVIARRLGRARAQADPLRRAELVIELARDTLGPEYVDHYGVFPPHPAPHRVNGAASGAHTNGAP